MVHYITENTTEHNVPVVCIEITPDGFIFETEDGERYISKISPGIVRGDEATLIKYEYADKFVRYAINRINAFKYQRIGV